MSKSVLSSKRRPGSGSPRRSKTAKQSSRPRSKFPLAAQVQRLEGLLDLFNDAIFVRTAEGTILDVNRRACELLGRKREELLGLSAPALTPGTKEDLAAAKKAMHDVRQRGQGVSEHRFLHSSGKTRPVEISARLIGQHPDLVLSIVRDISARKRAQEALGQSESLFRAIVSSTVGMLVSVYRRDGLIEFIHIAPDLEQKYGITSKQCTGRFLKDVLSPGYARMRLRAVERVFRTKRPCRMEWPVRHPNGQFWQDATYSPIFADDGSVRAVLGLLRDITQDRQAREDLRRSKADLEHLIDNTSDVIFQTDLQGNFTFGNRGAERLMGYPLEQLLKMNMAAVVVPEHVHLLRERLGRRRAGRRLAQPFEYDVITSQGKRISLEAMTSPLRRNGKLVGVQGLARDITARKQAQNALAEREQLLQLLLQHTSDGINITEVELKPLRRRLVLCNDRYVEMSGRSRQELMANPNIDEWHIAITPPARTPAQRRRGFLAREPRSGLASWRRPDGKENYFEWTGVPFYVGKKLFVVGIDRDVTARRQAEEAMREHEHLLQLVLQHSMDGINVVEVDFKTLRRKLVLCNNRYVESSGRSREELMRASRLSRFSIPREGTAVSPAEQRRQLLSGQSQSGIFSWLRPDGQENYHEWTSASFRVGKRFYVVGINRDITARRKMEAVAAENERLLRLILQNSADGINVVELNPKTLHSRLVFCNDRYVEMTGRSREELMQAENLSGFYTRSSLWPGTSAERRNQLLRGELQTGFSSWLRPDKKENYLEWTGVPFRDGDRLFVVGIDRDVTERRRQQKALEEAQAKLATAREEERRTLAGELHDSVGQGLIALQLAVHELATSGSGEVMAPAQKRASILVEHLITEVRSICQGLYPPTLESLGLHSALLQLSRDFTHVGVQVRWRVDGPAARFDRMAEIALFRIAQEALNNAIRHSQATRIAITVDYEPGRAILTISDNGKGFDTATAVGKGLGLPKMRERAETAGGVFTIHSGPRGTKVQASVQTDLRFAQGDS